VHDGSCVLIKTINLVINALTRGNVHQLAGKRLGSAILVDKATGDIRAYCIFNIYLDGTEAVCDGNPYFIPILARKYRVKRVVTRYMLDKIDPDAKHIHKFRYGHAVFHVYMYTYSPP